MQMRSELTERGPTATRIDKQLLKQTEDLVLIKSFVNLHCHIHYIDLNSVTSV